MNAKKLHKGEPIHTWFFIPWAMDIQLNAVSKQKDGLFGPIKIIAESYLTNTKRTIATLGIPDKLSTLANRRTRFAMALDDRDILRRAGVGTIRNDRLTEDQIKRLAKYVMDEETTNPLGAKIAELHLGMIQHALRDSDYEAAIRGSFRQALVSIWTNFEVAANDCIEFLLKRDDDLANRLVEDDRIVKKTRKKQLLSLSHEVLTETLIAYGAKSASQFLAVFEIVSGNPISHSFPEECEAIALLNDNRNLIVHEDGIVTKAYKELHPDGADIGEQLDIRPADIGRALKAVDALLANVFSQQIAKATP